MVQDPVVVDENTFPAGLENSQVATHLQLQADEPGDAVHPVEGTVRLDLLVLDRHGFEYAVLGVRGREAEAGDPTQIGRSSSAFSRRSAPKRGAQKWPRKTSL